MLLQHLMKMEIYMLGGGNNNGGNGAPTGSGFVKLFQNIAQLSASILIPKC